MKLNNFDKRMRRSVSFTVLFLTFAVALTVATCALAYAADAAESTHALIIEDFDEESTWTAYHNVSEEKIVNQQYGKDVRSCLRVTPVSADNAYSSVIKMYTSSKPLDLYNYAKLSYKLFIPDPPKAVADGPEISPNATDEDAETPIAEAAPQKETYSVAITLHSGAYTSEHTAKIPAGSWYTITADISEWFRRSEINAIEISVYRESDDGAVPHGGYFLIDTITAFGEPDVSSATTFLSNNFEGYGCEIAYDSGENTMTLTRTDEGNAPYIQGNIYVEDRASLAEFNAVRIVLENNSTCESVRLDYSSDSDILSNNVSTTSSQLNKHGTSSYLMYITPGQKLDLIKFIFPGSWEGEITVSAISLVTVDDGFTVSQGGEIGAVSRCELSADGNFITVKGTIPADTAAKYIGCRLNLYELSSYEDASAIGEMSPAVSIDISTRFEFKLPVSGREIESVTYKYAVALEYEGEIILIDNAKYVTNPAAMVIAEAAKQPKKSLKGFHDIGVSGVFEAGNSHIVIDVACEDFLIPKEKVTGTGKLHVRGGYYYYFNAEYIKHLDDRVKMYSLSGSDVLLRLVSADRLENESITYFDTDYAASYAFNTSSEASINQLCAIVDYLSVRYSGEKDRGKISGFIVGTKVDQFYVYNNAGSLTNDLSAYVKSCADALRIVHSTAYINIPDIKVYASTGGDYVYTTDEHKYIGSSNPETAENNLLKGFSDISVDPVLFIELLCRRISEEGAFPWYLMNEAAGGGYADSFEYARSMNMTIARMAKSYSCAPISSSVFWAPDTGCDAHQLAVDYMELFKLIADEKCANAVILSAARQETDTFSNLFAMLKLVDSGKVEAIAAQTELLEGTASVRYGESDTADYATGVYDYWNFTNAYDSQGWFAGEGTSSVSTRKNTVFNNRTLGAEMEGAEDTSCCVLMWGSASAPLDLSHTPILEFELMVTSQTESADILIILGSPSGRAEYTASITANTPATIAADISDLPSAESITYAAVLIRGSAPSTITISKISGKNPSIPTPYLKNLISPPTQPPPPADMTPNTIITIATTIVLTLTAILLLSKTGKRKDA